MTPVLASHSTGQANAGQVNATVSAPSGTTAGDLLVMVVASNATTISSIGWTAVSLADGVTMLTRVAVASEASSYTVTRAAAALSAMLVAICRITGADGYVDVQGAAATSTGTALTVGSAGGVLACLELDVLHLFGATNHTVTPPSGTTLAWSDSTTNGRQYAATRTTNAATGSRAWSWTTNAATAVGVTVTIRPVSQGRVWDGTTEVPLQAYVWDGTTEVPVTPAVWDGSNETALT